MNTLQKRLRSGEISLSLWAKAADRIDALEAEAEVLADLLASRYGRISALEAENAALKADAERYRELIMLIGNKYPEESRHDTARRYLINAEKIDNTAIDAPRWLPAHQGARHE